MIRDLGARTYDLIQHHKQGFEDLRIVRGFIQSFPTDQQEIIRGRVGQFMQSSDPAVKQFLLIQMTATFCAAAGQLSRSDLDALTHRSDQPVEFVLFLDTNFLYSILQLHDSSSNEAASKLVALLKRMPNSVRVRPYVLPVTVDETKGNLKANLYHVQRIHATPNIAHVAGEHLSGVLHKYFTSVGSRATLDRARQYFQPYIDNLIGILRDKGIELFNSDLSAYSTRQEIIDDVLGRLSHEERKYGKTARSYEALLHDVILWHVANEKRAGSIESPADAKYWVVTIDYHFLGWDEFKRRGDNSSVQVCLHPSSLVQMLQFWIPRDERLDEALLDTLRVPFFYQEFNAETERITLKILSALSRFENASDLSEDTVERVVVNSALRSRMSLSDDEQKEVELVREALVEQNRVLESKLRHANRSLSRKVDEISQLRVARERSVASLKAEIEARAAGERHLQDQLEELRAEHRARIKRDVGRRAKLMSWTICLAILLGLVGVARLTYGLVARNWGWLEPLWTIVSTGVVLGGGLLSIKLDTFHLRRRIEDCLFRRWEV